MTMIVNNEEKWAKCPIEGYEHYEVSNQGRLMNTKTGQILKPYVHYKGYHHFQLYSGGKVKRLLAHRLVWMAFRGEIPLTMQVDHVDNDKGNNRLDNLQLLTPSENTKKHGGGWKWGEGKLRNRPKAKNPMSEETKAKLRLTSKAYHDARKASMMEP